MRRYILPALLFWLCLPGLARANGIVPMMNLFYPETWVAAVLVTIAIVLLESWILRRCIRKVTWAGTVWRSLVLNLASSAAGSVLLLHFERKAFFLHEGLALVVPLYFITVATEFPLLRLLYRRVPLAWDRAWLLGWGMNLASYALVFVLQFVFFVGWMQYAWWADQRDLVAWNQPSILRETPGRIYFGPPYQNHPMRVFDPATGTWKEWAACPKIDVWDVTGNTIAFLDPNKDKVTLATLPDFAVVRELEVDVWRDAEEKVSPLVCQLALSPDGTRLAILAEYGDVLVQRDRDSYYTLGLKCRLTVVDTATGEAEAHCPRWASDGSLCWTADAGSVLFAAFDDETIYHRGQDDVTGRRRYGRDVPVARSLYSFHLAAGEVARFAAGESPSLAENTGQILVRDGDELVLLDATGQEECRLPMPRLAQWPPVLSPDGEFALVVVSRNLPIFGQHRLLAVRIREPSQRHFLFEEFRLRYDWGLAGDE
ncbi:MAG: hypothetical protein RBU25_19245 [Lentisphaeria bacterium]|nr:hypothetical protein [Lentisphaeria bacterium]